MGFVGRKPTNAPLTSEDIPDNIITGAKIVDGSITGTDLAPGAGGIGFNFIPKFQNFTAVAGQGFVCDTLGLELNVTVQNVGGINVYFINAIQQPTLELVEGNTYRLNQSDASNSNHPLRFSETSNGTHGGGVEYTTGVTVVGTPGSAGAYTEIVVAVSAPTLYYYCTNHSAMGGQANTPATQPTFTVTLPANPTAGGQVQLVDYAGTFDSNALIINPNGENIEGGASNLQLSGEREGVILTYIDSTQGWLATSGINEGTDALEPNTYSIDFLVVAGGGGGGVAGGGAGGFRTSTQTVAVGTAITVTVGDGGAGVVSSRGNAGSNSSISGSSLTTITSAGGGGGGGYDDVVTTNRAGGSGGSGGGGFRGPGGGEAGGSGNTPSTSPSQGNTGGTGSSSGPNYGSGGGGGASAVGSNASGSAGGNGGNGTASSITGSSVTYAGGGGGGTNSGGTAGTGGTGGGGNGVVGGGGSPTAGTVNLGGGGGGKEGSPGGASGGKGVVILSMLTTKYSATSTGSPTVTTSGSNTILTFTGSGSYTA